MARSLSREAAAVGVRRLAVLPPSPLDGSDAAEGRRIADDLATEIARRGEVSVVERSLLPEVMEEHLLGQSGALDQQSLKRLGALEQAEAVAAGTFVRLGNTVEVNVRVIRIDTGVVVAARSARVKRDWFPELAGVIPEPAPISAEEAAAEVYEYQTGRPLRVSRPRPLEAPRRSRAGPITWAAVPSGRKALSVRDAVADGCTGAALRVDAMQAEILHLKARYWAAQAMKPGFSPQSLREGPGAIISDPALRRRFFELMEAEASSGVRPLSMSEVKQFMETDMRSFTLHSICASPRSRETAAALPEREGFLALR